MSARTLEEASGDEEGDTLMVEASYQSGPSTEKSFDADQSSDEEEDEEEDVYHSETESEDHEPCCKFDCKARGKRCRLDTMRMMRGLLGNMHTSNQHSWHATHPAQQV